MCSQWDKEIALLRYLDKCVGSYMTFLFWKSLLLDKNELYFHFGDNKKTGKFLLLCSQLSYIV